MGTNPLNFQNSLQLKSEFNKTGGEYANSTGLRHDQPLRQNLKIGLKVPLMATDVSEFGLSDLIFHGRWIPYVTKRMGLALGLGPNCFQRPRRIKFPSSGRGDR